MRLSFHNPRSAAEAIGKLLLLALLAWAVYHQTIGREDARALGLAFLNRFNLANLPFLLGCILLTPLNWGWETWKWQELVRPIVQIPFRKAFRAILAGITVSLFTPNRTGEYGGRILLVEAPYQLRVVVATLVGSIGQWAVLAGMGAIGACYFFLKNGYIQGPYAILTAVAGLVVCLLSLRIFFRVGWFAKLAPRRWQGILRILKRYQPAALRRILAICWLRYLTYALQYYLLLHFFGIEAPLWTALAGIATLFLFQTSLPLPPVLGVFARGEAALFIWGHFSDQTWNILGASFSLFILNLVGPALLGAIVIVQTNVTNSFQLANGKQPV